MTWTRGGDTAATYPDLMQVHGFRGADERTVNEMFGFLMRCAFQCAAHLTDYEIDAGTAYMMGGARTDDLIRLAVRAGLLTPIKGSGKRWLLRQDPDFIHIPTRAQVEWERQQRNDTRDPRLKVPVLLRDGDNCRWCGIGVHWRGRPTNRYGELDHLHPGEPGTPDTMYVACRRCNGGRGADHEAWDSAHTMRPAPRSPNYGEVTARYLTEHGYPTTPNVRSDETLAPAGADTAPDRVRPATPSDVSAAPTSKVAPKAGGKSLPRSDETASAGSGRVGSGSPSPPPEEDARASQPSTDPSASRPRRRGRRGGRSPAPPEGETS